MQDSVDARLTRFKVDLVTQSSIEIVERHIIFGDSFGLEKDTYFTLKSVVAQHFSINPAEVVMVGSAKLGFSIAPTKRYRPFSIDSDLDLAIVSSTLFDSLWEAVFDYAVEKPYWAEKRDFNTYLARGWIRPDKLPPGFAPGQDWWDFFRELTATGNFGDRTLRAGLYRTWHFMRSYHQA